MPITVNWYEPEHKIVIWEFVGEWDWPDYHAAINQAVVMLKGVNHTVDSIIDVRRNAAFPANMLIQGRRWFQVAPSNFGVTVVTGANALLKGVATTIGRLLPRFTDRILFADTVEEAEQLIRSRRKPASNNHT